MRRPLKKSSISAEARTKAKDSMGQPIYEKSAINLLKDFAKQHFASGRSSFTFRDAQVWVSQNYPLLSEERILTNLTILSTNSPARRNHSVHKTGTNDVLFAEVDGSYRAFVAGFDPPPISESNDDAKPVKDIPPTTVPERWKFDQEKVLQSYLVNNLEKIEPGLVLHRDQDTAGIEYACGNRRIDILARGTRGEWVVIELKADRAHDRVVGQIALYMQWIKANVAGPKDRVRGIIVGHDITAELRLAAGAVENLSLKQYNLMVQLSDC